MQEGCVSVEYPSPRKINVEDARVPSLTQKGRERGVGLSTKKDSGGVNLRLCHYVSPLFICANNLVDQHS